VADGSDWIDPSKFVLSLEAVYLGEDCEMDWGSYANVVSVILFFVTGIVMLIMGAPTRPPPKEQELHTVTYQQETNEQGDPVVQEVNTEITIVKGANVPAWSSVSQPATIPIGTSANDAEPWEQTKS
jgi:hypothetical protein